MKQEILERIKALGGNIDNVKGNSLKEDLQKIKFSNPLYPKSFAEDLYGVDEFYEKHKNMYLENKDLFYKNIGDHYFSDHEIPYGQSFFRNFLFTPFKEGSEDFGELDEITTEDEIREVIKCDELDFMCICYSYGFPDHYFICLGDSNQSNPVVYSTDHEEFFTAINHKKNLEDFFKRFLTKEEFLDIVKDYLENR
ncbi:hypothetical protein NNC19_05460 [Clostridium sp. SHJSY1]|nr:hypothetical protein [Clostridium sp. SHJSY1]